MIKDVEVISEGGVIPMNRPILLILCALFIATAAFGGDNCRAVAVFQAGETLQYSVKWKFFRLGTLTLRTDSDSTSSDINAIRVRLDVMSNPALQFVWIRETNECHMETVGITTRRFLARHRNGDDLVEIRPYYDQAARTAFFKKTDLNSGQVLESDTIFNTPPFVEGSALLFKARALSPSKGVVNVPTMVNGLIQNTILEFGGEHENLSIDAWGQDIRTRKYTGRAEWSGGSSAGLSGEFTGWVSDDDAAVPIRAEMKILFGSITLELEQWTRQGWIPPSGPIQQQAERSQP